MEQPDSQVPGFDRRWLESMGYTGLDNDHVRALCDLACTELERRTGSRLYELLDETQRHQADILFGDHAEQARLDWLSASGIPVPDQIITIANQSGPGEALEALCDQIPTIWLVHTGLPYARITATVRDEITDEFRAHHHAIMARLAPTTHQPGTGSDPHTSR